jgi:hypothetical protein
LDERVTGVTIRIGSWQLDADKDVSPRTVVVYCTDRRVDLSLLQYMPHIKRLEINVREPLMGRRWLIDGWDSLRYLLKLEEFETPGSCAFYVPVPPAGIRRLGEMKSLRKLSLGIEDTVTPEELAPLGQLENLTDLQLYGKSFTADQLRFVSSLHNLRVLRIFAPPRSVDDEHGLRYLAQLKQLEELRLYGVSDVAMPHIGAVKSLVEVTLDGKGITDEGSRYLDELPALKSIYVTHTSITKQRVLALLRNVARSRVREDR